jgi:hypothetical protein
MVELARLTGACSAVGGAALTAACLVHNSLPQGCIDAGCDSRVMRGSSPADLVLFAVAGLMLAVSGVGLLLLTRRKRGGRGAMAATAGIAGAAGLVLLLAAGVVSTFVDDDWEGMPGLVVPGVALLALGLVLVAVVVIRARVLPTPLSALLLATVVTLPFANEQTSRILLAVPFGLTWLGAGVLLLRSSEDGTAALA